MSVIAAEDRTHVSTATSASAGPRGHVRLHRDAPVCIGYTLNRK
ncbi:Hypothetical protein A7982_08075 [Minicystis rosea]|nr:Hypothetical protein A7982_08075 [Minicystis rosea]